MYILKGWLIKTCLFKCLFAIEENRSKNTKIKWV